MAVTADSVVVELEAKVDGYQAAISGAAKTTDTAMSSIERSAGQAEASMRGSLAKIEEAGNRTGASQMILQSIVRRTTDQFAAGAPISVILAEHLSGVAEAGALAGGKLGALGEFLGGPWGIAVSAAVSVLSILIAKFADGEHAAKKQKDAIDLLTDALGQYAKANGQAVNNDYVRIRLIEAVTKSLSAQEVQTRKNIIAQLEAAKAQAAVDRERAQAPGQRGENASLTAAVSSAQVSGLEAQLEEQNKKLADAERRARIASGARAEADNAANPVGKDPIAAGAARVKAAQDAYAVTLFALQKQLADGRISQEQFNARQSAAQNAELAATNADAIQRKDDAEQRKREAAERRAERAAESAANKELREAARAAAEAERARVKALNELSAYSREFNTKFERQFAQEGKDGVRDFEKDQDHRQQLALDDAERLRQKQAENIRSLADLYQTAFTRGSKGIGDALKQELTRAIAVALAKLTLEKLGSLSSSGGILGAIGNLAKGITPSSGGKASGGYVGAGQLYQVNENASPGNVEGFRPQGSGEIIPLGQMKAAMGGGPTIVNQHFTLDARYGITSTDLIQYVNETANQAATRGAAGGAAMAQANAARRARYRLGS